MLFNTPWTRFDLTIILKLETPHRGTDHLLREARKRFANFTMHSYWWSFATAPGLDSDPLRPASRFPILKLVVSVERDFSWLGEVVRQLLHVTY